MKDKAIDGMPTEELESVGETVATLVEKAFDLSRDGDQGTSMDGNWSAEVNAMLTAATLKGLFFSEDWVFIVCDLIASKISAQTMEVLRDTVAADGSLSTEPDESNPLNDLLWSPNPFQDYSSFMYLLTVELFLMGNAVIWFNKRKRTLFVLQGDLITLDIDSKGSLRGYLLARDNTEEALQDREGMARFAPDEIIHIRRPNPSSLLWGLSPFVPGRKPVLFNRYSADYVNAFYLKQATPGLAVTMDRTVNEEMALRQLRSFENAYSGRRNARRTMILPKGVDVKALAHTIADQRLIEMIDKNRETILALLKVPKHEVSLQTSGSLGSEEYKTALRNFWESTLKPAMGLISGAFTKFFAGVLGPDAYFEFNLDDVEALQDDHMKKAELGKARLEAGWTINEVREADGLVASVFPQSDVPGPLIVKMTAPVPQAAPAVSPPPVQQQSLDLYGDEKEIEAVLNKAGTSILEQHKALEDRVASEEKRFVDMASDRLVDMAEAAVRAFKGIAREKQHLFCPTVKAAEVDVRELQRRIEDAFGPIQAQYLDEYITILEATVEFGYDTQLKVVLNKPNREAIQAIRARDASGRRVLLEARGLRSFAWISQTQTEKIMKEITAGMEKNETIFEISQRIASTFADPVKMIDRARVIARTETLTAVSQGQWASMQDAKTVIPGLKKGWLTAGDERVRPTHVANDHLVRSVDAKFPNGLQYPRDPSGEAKEVIQCRCTLVMLPPGQSL